MSEDPAEFEKQVLSSDKRFEIYVPKPMSRLNMGKPAANAQPDGPFGHDGITVSTEKALFQQAQNELVVQSGKDANLLVGGALGQYVSKDAQITAGEDLRLAGGKRVLLISGAHNAPNARSDHGTLRLQSYNNLAQHYRVDALEVGLFEFFHGRRDRPKRDPGKLAILLGLAKKDKLGKFKPGKRKRFDHSDPAFDVELAKDPELQGGFTQNLLRTMTGLYPSELDGIGDKGEVFFPPNLGHYPNTRKAAEKVTKIPARKGLLGLFPRPAKSIPAISKIKDDSDPRYWIEPLFTHERDAIDAKEKGLANAILGTKDILELEFGFSRYYSRFDPYKQWKPHAFNGWAARAMLTLQNGLMQMRRRLDCLIYTTGLPGALVDMIAQAPVVGPVLGALGACFEAFSTCAELYDNYKQTYSDKDTQNPFAEPAAELIKPFTKKADERKASVKSCDGPWDLTTSTDPWTLKLTTETGLVRDLVLDLGPIPPRPAVLRFTVTALEEHVDKEGKVTGTDEVTLALEIDGRRSSFTFDVTNAPGAAEVAAILARSIRSLATVDVAEDLITITTHSTGPEARILVETYEDNAEARELWPLVTGWLEQGHGAVPPVADPAAVTAAEIAARVNPVLGAVVSDVGGGVRFTSDHMGNGSYVAVEGSLASKMFTPKPTDADQKRPPTSDRVAPKIAPDWETVDSGESLVEPIQTWVEWVKGLPEKSQAMFQPLVDACTDLIAVMESIDKVLEGILGIAAMGGPEIPETPESVGIFGTQGITLGTQDRIVASGGHGILFVVDGGSGEADKGKMVGKLEWTARFAGGFTPPRKETKRQSLGFRVFSDSVVDLSAANGAQLLAMGRGKAKENRPHGDKIGGVGVARVLSSWVTEITGNEKVIISARSKGDPSDADALTGGRVEVAAQTIAIGGVRVEDKDADGNEIGPWDWDETRTGVDAHSKSFGITPVELETVAMSEHLTLEKQKKGHGLPPGPLPHLKDMAKYAWPKVLRKTHPPTERVHVHSAKEALIVVGSFMIHVGKDEGVRIGYRKSNKDPSVNEVDEVKGTVTLDDRGITLKMPNKDKSDHTSMTIFEGQSILKGTDGSGDPGMVSLSEGTALVGAGANDSIEVSKSDGVKIGASKLEVTASGVVKVKGSNINIG